MSEMEEKLGAILSNPQLMQQIMSMAQSLNTAEPATPTVLDPVPKQEPGKQEPAFPNIDPGMLQSLAGIMQGSRIDKNQQSLLNALCPFMSHARVHKLEKAMKAAKIAGLASNFLNSGGLKMLTGR